MDSRPGSSYTVTAFPVTGDVVPDFTGLARAYPRRYPFLLESVAAGPDLARFDILFAFPGETLELRPDGSLTGLATAADSFLTALDAWWAAEAHGASAASPEALPFQGGWFLFLGYELAQEVEPSLHLDCDPRLPVAFATRVPVAVVRDRQTGMYSIVAEAGHEAERDAVLQDLRTAGRGASPEQPVQVVRVDEDPAAGFIDAVERAKAHIAAGDIFQANLSRCWKAALRAPATAADLYAQLREANPAPFAGLIQRDDFALISSSPERLVRRRGERLDTRPIAGTRRRTGGAEQHRLQKEGLLGHPKERAEHVMLIDLERNDLGRVCVGGSVAVDEFMVIESYRHVHHIVSNITGRARPGLLPGELIRAVFPGGTITGCPKVRCMEIIHALEQRPRGAYTGSMGYLNRNGDCDLNILIRTMCVIDDSIEIAAGSGIVADSDPQRELDETRAKAQGLLLSLAGKAG